MTKVMKSFYMDVELNTTIHDLSDVHGRSFSWIINEAVKDYISRIMKKETSIEYKYHPKIKELLEKNNNEPTKKKESEGDIKERLLEDEVLKSRGLTREDFEKIDRPE